MEKIGEAFIVGRPERRTGRRWWWVGAATAMLAIALAVAVIVVRVVVTPPAVPCPLPEVPGSEPTIAWANDSRSAIFTRANNGVSLVRVPELTVRPLPNVPEFPVEVALPAGGRPIAVTLYDPRLPSSSGQRSRGPATQYFIRRLSADGKRWERCLDNRFSFRLSPDCRHVAATDRVRLRVWRLPDLSLERSVALPQGCAGRHSGIYWSDNRGFALMIGPAPRSRWEFRLDTGKLERANWPITLRQAAGFRVVRRGVPGASIRNWWTRWRGEEPFEDWELIAAPAGMRQQCVSLGRGSTNPSDGAEGPCLIQGSTAVAAIPSPDGRYAFVPAADGTVRLWTPDQRAR